MINCSFSPENMEDGRLPLLRRCLSVTHTREHPSFSQTHPAAPHTVAYTLDQTHTKSQWAIFICPPPPSLSFCLCNLSLYKWSQAGSPYLEQRRQKKVGARVTARLDDDRGQLLANMRLEALQSFCCSLILEATFEDGGVLGKGGWLGMRRVWAVKEEKKPPSDLRTSHRRCW